MPSYARNPWSCIFFIVYLSLELYFIMNLVRPLPVNPNSYTHSPWCLVYVVWGAAGRPAGGIGTCQSGIACVCASRVMLLSRCKQWLLGTPQSPVDTYTHIVSPEHPVGHKQLGLGTAFRDLPPPLGPASPPCAKLHHGPVVPLQNLLSASLPLHLG